MSFIIGKIHKSQNKTVSDSAGTILILGFGNCTLVSSSY